MSAFSRGAVDFSLTFQERAKQIENKCTAGKESIENMFFAEGLFRELNPGPLAPEARIMPLDQTASETQCHWQLST